MAKIPIKKLIEENLRKYLGEETNFEVTQISPREYNVHIGDSDEAEYVVEVDFKHRVAYIYSAGTGAGEKILFTF